jgi:hypothetical protein
VQTLHYLKESLKGATLESTIDSFQSLWSAVCKKNQIRRIIVDKHIDELIRIKPIQQESSGELHHVSDVAVKNLRVLQTMELKMAALSKQVMVNLISNRLDVETCKAYEIQLKADVPTKWNEMQQFLQQRCHTLESIKRRNTGIPLKVTSSTPTLSYRRKNEPN